MEKEVALEYALEMLENKKFVQLKGELQEMNPADIAVFVEELKETAEFDEKKLILLYRILPKETAAEAFTYMDSDTQMTLINAFSDKELRYVIDELYLDDTVDIIEEMPANVVSRILKNIDSDTRKQINQLLNYPKDSAGSVMTTEFVYFQRNLTVKEAFEQIRKIGLVKETVYTCYVISSHRRLVGIVTVLDMLVADGDTRVEDIMESNVISVKTHDDREEVARALSKYDFAAIPVVDNENRIVGIVTFDDAMDVIRDEDTEDIEKMAAMLPSEKPYMKTGVFKIYKQRIPWLILLMVSATFTGTILAHFEDALAVVPALTVFIPMLMDTGGNSGGQASVTIIRGLSLNEISFRDIFKVMWKELRVGIMCAATIAVISFGKVMLIDRKSAAIGGIVASTIFCVIVTAKLVGCSLPMLAKKIGFDPAVMASPFITTIVDALALFVYFAIASKALGL
ncbi:MAG: magnesium transporter [Oscillospiraceae bacterium]|nr:magnesium transporter [Oscillospiraceae bacterium]MDE6132460.1 magnesium transporter [Oscillospiraceae bacterium]